MVISAGMSALPAGIGSHNETNSPGRHRTAHAGGRNSLSLAPATRPMWWCAFAGLQGGQELGEQASEGALLGGGEGVEQRPLVREMLRGDLVDQAVPVLGEFDEQPTGVGGVR